MNDCNITWDETKFTLDDFSISSVYSQIAQIVGQDNRIDILHLDSAYKDQVDLFLTSDKGDIWNRRREIEKIVSYKIYHTTLDQDHILDILASVP